jgi:two-component system nitrogen regulation sensor histidine kinase GlnL
MDTNSLDHLLLENLSTAVLLLDGELTVQYVNPSAETLLAASATRVLGSRASTFFAGSENRLDALQNALDTGDPFTERRAFLNLKDQGQTAVDYTVTPLVSGASRFLLVEMQAMDRILRIDREEALITAHDTSRNLVKGLAHEIKNPLGGIRGAAQLLSAELKDAELREYTDIIANEVERLCRLVDRLLGPNKPAPFSAVNIHEVTEHVASLVEAETRGELVILRDYDPSIPEVQGNREQLIQAILNIVRNAMQSLKSADMLGKGGTIRLRTRIQRHFTIGKVNHRVVCRLDIIDNGPGIPAEISERIFFPMISGRPEGSGLGLPIAQSTINTHNGLVECDSRPGHTRFTIFLPIECDDD